MWDTIKLLNLKHPYKGCISVTNVNYTSNNTMVVIRKTDKVKEIENDLRPISLTSILSKTVDYFVADWIMLQLT